MDRLNIGIDAARSKIRHFCAYQERCHSEVKSKLYEMRLRSAEVDELLAELVHENFLNEERFAIAFAGGKFRIKKWGKVKIRHALKLRSVSDYCIKKALQSLDDEDYLSTLEELASRKCATLTGNIFRKKQSLKQYLLQKGYEMEFVSPLVNKI